MISNNANNSGKFCRAMQRMALTAVALTALASVVAAAPAAPAGPERTLAGISIFAPGSEVTQKFGNPSLILVGGVGAAPFDPAAGASPLGAGGASGTAGSSPGGSAAAPNPGAGLLPGFAGVPGGAAPGGVDASGAPIGGPGAAPVAVPKMPVTLIYNRPNGGSLEFTISPDKRVIQIRETGYTGSYGTTRGIKLGTTYSAVVARYGYPENTYIQGSIISTDYKDTLHCGFQFLDQKLVGIIVASPD